MQAVWHLICKWNSASQLPAFDVLSPFKVFGKIHILRADATYTVGETPQWVMAKDYLHVLNQNILTDKWAHPIRKNSNVQSRHKWIQWT